MSECSNHPSRSSARPREIEGLDAIYPMQVQGPDGEIVYLTQIRDDLPAFDLPRAEAPIDRLFILVMACSDMNASLDWLEAFVGFSVGRRRMDMCTRCWRKRLVCRRKTCIPSRRWCTTATSFWNWISSRHRVANDPPVQASCRRALRSARSHTRISHPSTSVAATVGLSNQETALGGLRQQARGDFACARRHPD